MPHVEHEDAMSGKPSGKDVAIEDLFDLGTLQEIQDEFALATGVASLITRPDGTPVTRPSSFCRLCAEIIRGTAKGLANCHRSDAEIGRLCGEADGPHLQPCLSGGLWDAGARIVVEGRHIANWMVGQVRNEAQSVDRMRAYAREIGADEEEFLAAFEEVPSMSSERFAAVARMLFSLARQLSTLAYRNIMQERIIGELRATEQALQESEERFRALHNASFGGLFIHDNGTILDCNQGLSEMTGYSVEELIGMYGSLLLTEDSRAYARQMMIRQEERPYEARGLRKNGETFPLRLEGRNIPYKGKTVRAIELRDMTEIKRAEEALRAAKTHAEWLGRQAETASRAKSAFLANTSHELRTPLNGVIGFLELLARTPLDEIQREYVDCIRTSAYSLRDIVSDVLDISKIEADKVELKLVRTDIQKLASQAMNIVRNAATRKGLDLLLRIADGAPRFALVDPPRIRQVLVNLLSNAVKFTHEGSVELALDFWPTKENTYDLTFSVRDTGIGIAQEDMRRLFEPFYQVDSSNTRQYGGTGLGLAISDALLKRMRSGLEVESAPGEGSRFFFVLRAECFFDEAQEAGATAPKLPSFAPLPVSKERPKILVVEDVKLNLRLMRVLISKLLPEAIILEAADGEAGIELFRRHSPDLVFMDLQMPVKDGYRATEEIRELEGISRRIPIIALTGDVQVETRDACLASGMDGYLTKPIDAEEVRRVLGRFLESDAEDSEASCPSS